MAVKITRQTSNIVLLGSATSAAGLRAGHERAAESLRGAGLAEAVARVDERGQPLAGEHLFVAGCKILQLLELERPGCEYDDELHRAGAR